MKILMAHGRYALRGGEDQVYESERDLLRGHGHTVFEYERHNDGIHGLQVLIAGVKTVWSQSDYRAIRKCIRKTGAQLVAVHNFFPLISPSIFYAAGAEGIPVVQTLHNYRLICPSATLLRDGEICKDCVGKSVPWPAVQHGCYRSSRMLTAGVSAMNASHRVLGTWNHKVSRYIALTEDMKEQYVAGGFDGDRIVVKPNSTEDTGVGAGEGNLFLYVGRLSNEKGVSILLRAWAHANTCSQLVIVGTGPEEASLKRQASPLRNVTFLGHCPRQTVQDLMGNAKAVIVPSIWAEPFGLTAIEAFAKGTPVLATKLGALQSLVTPGESGYLFERNDALSLAELLSDAVDFKRLRAGARQEYEQHFTPARNYSRLMEIYECALNTCQE